jgi:hypothetical protein
MFENWDKELEAKGKRGRPYKFPESFIKFQAILHQWMDYRSLEGIARALEKLGLIPHCDDYTTAWYRIHDMKPEIELPDKDEAEIAADGTGLKSGSAGEYRTYIYWNIRRRYEGCYNCGCHD